MVTSLEPTGATITAPRLSLSVGIIAVVVLGTLVATSSRYGYHPDEMYFIVSGGHPAFGYPDQPPLVPLLAWSMHAVAPGSLVVLRLPSAVAAAATSVVAALIARDTGGGARPGHRCRMHRRLRLRVSRVSHSGRPLFASGVHPASALLLGYDGPHDTAPNFDHCNGLATVNDGIGLDNTEQGLPVLLCRPASSWADLWPRLRHYN